MKRRTKTIGRTEIIRDLILDHLALVSPQCDTLDALRSNLSSCRHCPSASEFDRHVAYLVQHGLVTEEGVNVAITPKGMEWRKGSLSFEDGD